MRRLRQLDRQPDLIRVHAAAEARLYGYGKQILLWALENINLDRIVLHVAEWNQRAINLYKKTGFEITETIEIG